MRGFAAAAIITSLLTAFPAFSITNPDAYSVQNVLSGATPSLQASAGYGKGIVFGDIDTGITPQWIGFTPQYNGQGVSNINTNLSAVCLNGKCPTGAKPTDGNGHGTFTAGEIVGGIPSIGMEGVAPAGSLIAVQVMNASGVGYSNDVANGIVYAVNHGAQVLNLSLGPSGTAAQQAGFYESLAGAINYAASKNAIVVFAGGNSSQAFSAGANITGFTDAAISHMMFMGSTNASEQKSSFSNTPGSGYFISTSGKHDAYNAMWMMADGENIWGASNYYTSQYGYSYITQMSGTSMAAPQAAGAAGLLAAKWSFLLAQGTIPKILEQTATDLGAKGVDTTYGDGFINLAAAFAPIGTLSIPENGKMVPVTGAEIISGTAMGNMSNVSSKLQQMVAYDSYMRGFTIFAPSQVKGAPASSSTSSAASKVTGSGSTSSRTVTTFADGSGWEAFSGTPGDSVNGWSYGFSQNGNYMGMGQGSQTALSFNDARWGSSSAFFNNDPGASSALLSIEPTANFASVGMDLKHNARFAMSMFTTDSSDSQTGLNGNYSMAARGGAIAYTLQPTEDVKLSLTSSFLDESNMMLGSVSNGYLSLGSAASTVSLGIGTNVDLGDGYQVGFDMAYATTRVTGASASLVDGISRVGSESFSLAFAKSDVTGANDNLHISIDKPLRVVSGSANLDVPTGTDNNAAPIISQQRIGLTPNGSETDFNASYVRPLDANLTGSLNFSYRTDADNIAGAQNAAAIARLKLTF